MIRIHPSRYPDQATQSLYGAIKKSKDQGRRAYLVVPSQFTVEAEQGLLDYLQEDILLDVQVKSFQSLVREILQEGRGFKRPSLDDTGRAMLLRLILEDSDQDWESFPPSTRREGLIEGLSRELKEYKEYGIGPDLLVDIADELEDSKDTENKLRELAQIYQAYNEFLEDSFLDGDDQLIFAFSQLKDLRIFDGIDFFFDNFNSMSKLELDGLKVLHDQGLSLDLAMTIDPDLASQAMAQFSMSKSHQAAYYDGLVSDAEAFSISLSFLEKLNQVAEGRLKIQDTSKEKGAPHSVFAHGAKSVFSYKNEVISCQDLVELKSYRNTEAEIDGLILDIEKRVQEEGIRYKDIQVVISNKEEYGNLIHQKFELEGIPFFMDETRSIDHHPFIRFIRSLLQLALRNYRQEDVFNFLKTGLHSLTDEKIEVYQNFVQRRKIDGWKFLEDDYFTVSDDYLNQHEREADRIRKEVNRSKEVNDKLLDLSQDFVEGVKKDQTIYDFARLLYQAMDQEEVHQAMDKFENSLEESEDQARAMAFLEEHQQIWDAVMQLLDQLVEIGRDLLVSYEVFAQLITEGLSSISLGIIPPSQDQVILSEVLRSRTRTRDYVYFIGMGDIYLPSQDQSQDILTQEEKNLLQEKGFFLPSMKDFSQEEEKLGIYSGLSKVGKRLSLSYSIQNTGNEPINLSFWIQQYQKGFTDLEEEVVDHLPLKDQVYSRSLISRTLPKILREEEDEEIYKDGQEILQAMMESESMHGLGDLIQQGLAYTNIRPKLSQETVHGLYGEKDRVSASQVERFAACPYQYFMDYAIRPQEHRSIDMDGRDIGNVAHQSIDQWTAYVAKDLEAFRTLEEEESAQILQEAFGQMQESFLDEKKREESRNSFLLKLMSKTLEETNEHLYRQVQSSDMDAVYHEENFGRGKRFEEIELDLGDRVLYVEGRIDRVDELRLSDQEVYLQVIDYKSSKRSFNLTQFLGGLQLQLAIYLKAATDQNDPREEERKPLGCFYLPITASGQIDEEKLDNLEKILAEEGLLSGIITDRVDIVGQMDHSLHPSKEEQNKEKAPISLTYEFKGRSAAFEDKENVLTDEEMKFILTYALEISQKMMAQREEGEIGVHPYRIGTGSSVQVPCRFCDYQSICRFEKIHQFDQYRMIDKTDWKTWREERDGQGN